MGYTDDRQMIRPAVSIYDLQIVLGTSKNDLGDIVVNATINKWAWYKPVRHVNIGMINDSIRQSVNFGLYPQANTKANEMLQNPTSVTEADFNAAVGASFEWGYNRPRGGGRTPQETFRLTDFADEDLTHNRGYKKDTDPPVCIVGGWGLLKSDLEQVLTYGIFSSGTSPNQVMTVKSTRSSSSSELRCGLIPEHLFKFRFGLASNENINGADTMTIPLTYIFNLTTSDVWRMGLLVYVPGYTSGGNTFSSRVGVFVSLKKLQNYSTSIDTVPKILPDMATNQNLVRHMVGYLDSINGNSYSFRCLPVLVRNIQITPSTENTDSTINAQNVTVYTMPSSMNDVREIAIEVSNSEQPSGDDSNLATTNGWTLGVKFSGDYSPVNGVLRPVRQIVVFKSTDPSVAPSIGRTFNVTVKYTRYLPNGSTDTVIKNNYILEVATTDRFTSNGVNYYGRIIDGGIDLAAATSDPTPQLTIV